MIEPIDTSKLGAIKVDVEFTEFEISIDNILQYFAYQHLREPLRDVSLGFAKQARYIIDTCPRCPERSVALRKLLEAKDAAVRAMLSA